MNTAPKSIQIDATSNCQLACPVCPTADGRTKPVLGRGHLQVADFEALLDRNPELLHVELSNYGEMFLNPHLPEILEVAHRRGVTCSGNNGTNLNFAREEALEAVVKYRVRGLTCSIDGATPEVYAQYRRNGNLENVLRNIDRINEYKERYGTAFPLLYWQFVVFGHNEHELELARRMAKERGMGLLPRLSWSAEHSPVQNKELVTISTGLGAATRKEFKEQKGVEYTRNICYQLWQAPVVNWDGKLLGCCVNFWGDFGSNVFAEGLENATHNPKMEQARAMLTGASGPVEGIPCTTCDQYTSMQESGRWLTEAEIEQHPAQQYVVSLRVMGGAAMRHARVAVFAEGQEVEAGTQHPPLAGRVFRLGVDRAVMMATPAPGRYEARVEVLTPRGWDVYAMPFVVGERPLCSEFVVDLQTLPQVAAGAATAQGRAISTWIV